MKLSRADWQAGTSFGAMLAGIVLRLEREPWGASCLA